MKKLKIGIAFLVLLLAIALAGCTGQQVENYCDQTNQIYGETANYCLPPNTQKLKDLMALNNLPEPQNSTHVKTVCTKHEEPGPIFGWPINSYWTVEITTEECTPDKYAGCKIEPDGLNAYCYAPSAPPADGEPGRPAPSPPPEM